MIGQHLGPYHVLAKLGEGGMGEVYRGRDTRLHRDVALKVLPGMLSQDPERRARFEREATVLAALNHPNIAAVYGVTESANAIVMEFVDGETLADRIARGALPADEAVAIARQVADALDAAHERGIIHRDLKPANIKVTRDGIVKVLDFGLAKASEELAGSAGPITGSDPRNSPTLTSPAMMTRAGVILGTAAYMSPEQAKGRPVDKRADIWAFGCVLFEMLTGRPVFAGDTVTETLAAVMRDEPRLDQLPATTPPVVLSLLARCLERDPKRRLRDIGEARIALDQTFAPSSAARATPRETEGARAGRPFVLRTAPWIVAAASLAAAGFFAAARPSNAPPESLELEIAPPPDTQFLIDSNLGNVSLSPDGTRIVFHAGTFPRESLWIRSLARDDARPLAGTEGATYQFWAPDGRRLGFFAGGKLKTLDIAAGLPQTVADVPNPRGASWGEDDVILFGSGGGVIAGVSARGGTPADVTRLDTSRGENAHYWPQILPGGKKFLYFVRSTRVENSGIHAAGIDGSEPVRVVSSLSSGLYAPPLRGHPGYLLWVQNGALLAQPFDAKRGAVSGQPATIASDVRVLEAQRGMMATISRTGGIAWATPRATQTRFTWFARDGNRLDTVEIPSGETQRPTISPDGRRIAFTQMANGGGDIFIYELATRSMRRLSQSPEYDEGSVWSSDSSELVHRSNDQGLATLMRAGLDGSPPVELVRDKGPVMPAAWSPDRRHFLFSTAMPGLGAETLVFPTDHPKQITTLLTGPADEFAQTFSPDGRWIAFNSNRSGRTEAYLVRFRGDQTPPALGGHPLQVSTGGGRVLAWRRDGKELLLTTFDDQIAAVTVDARGDSISAGQPTPLFRLPPNHGYVSAAPDADRFLIQEYPYQAGQTIRVLTNWQERIR
jgi:Tol biopolymer transport system component/predicted Ser/Thr protein kinase